MINLLDELITGCGVNGGGQQQQEAAAVSSQGQRDILKKSNLAKTTTTWSELHGLLLSADLLADLLTTRRQRN